MGTIVSLEPLGEHAVCVCTAARANLLFMSLYLMRLKTKLYASSPSGARICAETFQENLSSVLLNLWKIIRGKMFSMIQKRIADYTLFRGNWLPLFSKTWA